MAILAAETTSAAFSTRVDVNGATTYVGEALPGTLVSEPLWKIKKLVETGPDIAITWANGDAKYEHIWDDRLTLTYL